MGPVYYKLYFEKLGDLHCEWVPFTNFFLVWGAKIRMVTQ